MVVLHIRKLLVILDNVFDAVEEGMSPIDWKYQLKSNLYQKKEKRKNSKVKSVTLNQIKLSKN